VVFVTGEEAQHALAISIVVRVFKQRLARAGTRKIDFLNAPNPGSWSIGHHHHALGKQDRLVDIMRDDDRGGLVAVSFRLTASLWHASGKTMTIV
jgi:hypothetical protein